VPSSVREALYSFLFCAFMACVLYSLQQRVFIYDCYVKEISYKSNRRNFPESTRPSGDTFSKLVKKVKENGILIDRKPVKRNHVLTWEGGLDDICHRLENSL
jgi:hypothetical protein